MKISKKLLEKFKQLYKVKFGIELDDNEANELAQRLAGLVRAVSRNTH